MKFREVLAHPAIFLIIMFIMIFILLYIIFVFGR